MRGWFILFLTVVLVFPSCQSTSSKKKGDDMIGEIIRIPEQIGAFKGGKLSVPVIQDTLTKYGGALLYYCGKEERLASFEKKIPLWTDTWLKCFPDVPIIFLFASEHKRMSLIKCSELNPGALFVFDFNDRFLRLNSFVPDQSSLRVFALDSQGQIVICGNLADNETLRNQFKKIRE